MIDIIDNMEMPKPVTRRANRDPYYPFEELKVGQGFIVEAKNAVWRTGKLSKTGKVKRFSQVHQQASYIGKRDDKKFQCATNKDRSVSVKRIR